MQIVILMILQFDHKYGHDVILRYEQVLSGENKIIEVMGR